jgi:hypothetical protein
MPDVPLPTLFLGLFIGALAVLIPLFVVAYGFLQKFATKTELALHKAEMDRIEAHFAEGLALTETRLTATLVENRRVHEDHYVSQGTKIDGLVQTLQLFTNDINRAVGAIEGRAAVMEKFVEATAQQNHAPPN